MKPSRRGIAIVVPNLDALGGMERQAKLLADRLGARGIPVTIVTTRAEPPLTFPPGPIPPCHERRGPIEIIRTPIFWNWTPRAGRRLTEVVAIWALMRRRRRIGALYAVQFTGAMHASVAARVTELPAVVKFACAGEYGDFALLAKESEAEGIRDALRRMDRYVIISEEIRKEAAAAGLDPARFVRIRNGVDAKRFSPGGRPAELPELGPSASREIVLFVGRLDRQKRIAVLVRSFAKVLTQVPGARLAVAGSGPCLDECRALTHALGIADKVAFLGPRADVDALHRAAAVFVLPSVSEGLPNALLEALACGTPSVATDIPGTTDLVTDGKEALLVPVDDTDALAAAVARLLRDRDLARRLAAAGRERIEAEFDIERVAEQYVALFSGLARARRSSDLVIQARFVRAMVPRIAWLLVAIVAIQLRDTITTVVVGTKRLLGIEGDVLSRRRPGFLDPPSERH